MRVRQFVIAVAAAAVATTSPAAEPKAPVRNAVQPTDVKSPVVVASVEPVRTPAGLAEAQAATPAKRVRTARVTSCRCGGQSPSEN